MLTENEIREFIVADYSDEIKKYGKIGERYYEARHDILNYKLYYCNSDGIYVEDKNKSNIKISHAFFRELVDQLVQYMLSSDEPFILSDIPKLQKELDDYFNYNDDFIAELTEVMTGCSKKGYEYMYAYLNEENRLAFQCADSMGVIEVRAEDTTDKCDYIIYWYVDRIEKGTRIIKKIQVWNDKETYFYIQEDDGKLVADDSQQINPRPHIVYTTLNDNNLYYKGFGYIPFFRLDNCKKRISDLALVKGLIDDYDLMSCGLSNNIQDSSEYFVVVKDYQGEDLDELIQNVKTKKHIGVDENGGFEIKTVEIPYQARQTKLELDEKNIYRFGFGLNLAGLKDTAATTNIAIKAAYSLLDLKANKLERRLRQFLRKIVKVVLAEVNGIYGTAYTLKDVYFSFTREIPTNEQENAQVELSKEQAKQTAITTILNVATQLDNETIIKTICNILDIDYEEIKDKIPQQEDPEMEIQQEEDTINSLETAAESPEVVADE